MRVSLKAVGLRTRVDTHTRRQKNAMMPTPPPPAMSQGRLQKTLSWSNLICNGYKVSRPTLWSFPCCLRYIRMDGCT